MTKNLPIPASPHGLPAGFSALLEDVKSRIRSAQTRAVLTVNTELVRLYWDIGRMIDHRQKREGWGAAVIPRLSRELHNELPEVKGFSERNIKRMLSFYRAYAATSAIVPQPVAQIGRSKKAPRPVAPTADSAGSPLPRGDSLLWLVPWGHHALLLEKVKEPAHRLWYMQQSYFERRTKR